MGPQVAAGKVAKIDRLLSEAEDEIGGLTAADSQLHAINRAHLNRAFDLIEKARLELYQVRAR